MSRWVALRRVLLDAKERTRHKRFIRSRAMCYEGMEPSDVSLLY
jgi:hypothetical protein